MRTLVMLLACCVSLAARADDGCPANMNKAKAEMMVSTKLVAVTNLSVPADKYVSSEPEALEIVFLSKAEDGASRVSDDGTVIFVAKDISDSDQQALIMKAFDIRLQRKFGNHCH